MSALAEKQSSPSLFDIIDPPLVDLGTQSELFSGIYTPQAELGQPKKGVRSIGQKNGLSGVDFLTGPAN